MDICSTPSFEGQPTRSPDASRAMARRIQNDLYTMKVEDSRRRGIRPDAHEISVGPSTSAEHLTVSLASRNDIRAYDDLTLRLRLHEFWGQYCLFQWYFEVPLTDGSREVIDWPTDSLGRCATVVEYKEAEIAAMLWRLKFEQRRRADRTVAEGKEFARHRLLAQRIPMTVFGANVEQSTNEELLVASCEHAGMLAAIRWIRDPSLQWGQDGLMDLADDPFTA